MDNNHCMGTNMAVTEDNATVTFTTAQSWYAKHSYLLILTNTQDGRVKASKFNC